MADNYGWRAPYPEDNRHHHHHPHHLPHPYGGGGPPELYGSSGYLEKTSSFDSHGSPRMVHSYGYAPVPYQPPFTVNPYFHQYQSPPPPQVINIDYITELNPKDVLSGRGGATNSYVGNKNFRKLVKSHQEMYLNAKKRDKPSVASKIVAIIRESGGRFLRRCNNKNARNVVWVDIGDGRAREKTCQALREGAPEIRRRNILASPENHANNSSPKVEPPPTPTQPQQPASTIAATSPIVSSSSSPPNNSQYNHHHRDDSASPLVVRPWKLLLPQRSDAWMELAVDQLPDEHRELYLRDFLPPDPAQEPLQ